MADLDSIHDEIRHVRESDPDREVRETLESIERSLDAMNSEGTPKPERLKEVRAELDRLAADADPDVADRLDRLREDVREYERDVR